MRFLRAIIYVFVITCSVTLWDLCGKKVKELVSQHILGEEKNEEPAAKEETAKPSEPQKETVPPTEEKQSSKDSLCPNFEKGFADVAKKAMHSVVNVATMQIIKEENIPDIMDDFFKGSPFDDLFKGFFGKGGGQSKPRKATSLGSGFIVKVDKNKAYIVTNNHVVEKAKKIVVYLHDKTEIPAELHASDQRTDLAVLSIDLKILGKDADMLVPVKWGDSDELEEGNWVIAIGNPFGLGSTVTHGIVSGKGRSIGIPGRSSLSFVDDFIQHSAQINMGNSGGCLLNVAGKVVGINNVIFTTSGGNIGIGFAIPSNLAKNTVEQLIEHKRTFRGWLGAEVQLVTAKQAESVGLKIEKSLDSSRVFGAFVARVVPKGPAEKAGIKRGDIILEFDGKPISAKSSLTKIVGCAKIDSTVKAKIWRQTEEKGWKEITLSVKVGDFEKAIETGSIDGTSDDKEQGEKKEEEIQDLGITVSKIPEKMREAISAEFSNHLIITKVDETKFTGFFEMMFVPGDIIISANNVKITTIKQLKDVLNKVKNNKELRNKPVPFVIL
ncbi:MAG: trypsin-like peptidase domain-containing protein, partial [Holosporales bacterium]|nr:trypsin-like peptidase domain-containing protein [Holosporales bacterium]